MVKEAAVVFVQAWMRSDSLTGVAMVLGIKPSAAVLNLVEHNALRMRCQGVPLPRRKGESSVSFRLIPSLN
jgi:hypothetical protein